MRTIWKNELCKMASRKIVWLGLSLLAFFIGWRLYAERGNYTVTIGGQITHGQEAINLDRQLTAGYAGVFTEQTVQKIWNDFGAYYYDDSQNAYIGNFCNSYLTQRITNYNQLDVPSFDLIQFQKECHRDWMFPLFLSASHTWDIIRQQSWGFSSFPLPLGWQGWCCLQAPRFSSLPYAKLPFFLSSSRLHGFAFLMHG